MVRNLLEDCLTDRCPHCGSKNISCSRKRERSEEVEKLPMGKFLKHLLKAEVIRCSCRDCGYRWECRAEPLAEY